MFHTAVRSIPMSNRKVSESTRAYEAGFITLICRPLCMAYPTPPMAVWAEVAWSLMRP